MRILKFGLFGAALSISLFIAYFLWCPVACEYKPMILLEIPGTSLKIKQIAKSCSMFDGGRVKVVLDSEKPKKRQIIAEWFDIATAFDVFIQDNVINFIFLDDSKLAERHDFVAGLPVRYHWIVRPDPPDQPYLNWQEHPSAPEARAWAIKHSTIH